MQRHLPFIPDPKVGKVRQPLLFCFTEGEQTARLNTGCPDPQKAL